MFLSKIIVHIYVCVCLFWKLEEEKGKAVMEEVTCFLVSIRVLNFMEICENNCPGIFQSFKVMKDKESLRAISD